MTLTKQGEIWFQKVVFCTGFLSVMVKLCLMASPSYPQGTLFHQEQCMSRVLKVEFNSIDAYNLCLHLNSVICAVLLLLSLVVFWAVCLCFHVQCFGILFCPSWFNMSRCSVYLPWIWITPNLKAWAQFDPHTFMLEIIVGHTLIVLKSYLFIIIIFLVPLVFRYNFFSH